MPNAIGPQEQEKERRNFKKALLVVLGNAPFLLLVAAYFFFLIAIGMWEALLFIFVDSHLGWGHLLPMAFCLSFSIGTLSVWLWYRLANRLGKKLTWGVGVLMSLTGILSNALLSSESNWFLLLLSMTLLYSGVSALQVTVPSLLSDIVDYGTWKFGRNQAATYFAVSKTVAKIGGAIGAALSLAIAGGYGFDPALTTNSEEAITGLRMTIAWLPLPFLLIAIWFVARIPINEHRHKIIRRRLDARATAASTSCQAPSKPYQTSESAGPHGVLQGRVD